MAERDAALGIDDIEPGSGEGSESNSARDTYGVGSVANSSSGVEEDVWGDLRQETESYKARTTSTNTTTTSYYSDGSELLLEQHPGVDTVVHSHGVAMPPTPHRPVTRAFASASKNNTSNDTTGDTNTNTATPNTNNTTHTTNTSARPTSTATPTSPATSGRVLCSPGVHMRVHFDGFKGNWDEWYDQRDFEHGECMILFVLMLRVANVQTDTRYFELTWSKDKFYS